MRSLAIANQKGGVGKTTTAVNLARGLALAGGRVALIDLDPQRQATLSVRALLGEPLEASGTVRPFGERSWVVSPPSGARNGIKENIHDSLRAVRELDWLIVDCPSRLDGAAWLGLSLCQEVLVPIQAEFLSIDGLPALLKALEQVRRSYPGRAALRGVFINMLDAREPGARESVAALVGRLGGQLLETVVFRAPEVAKAAAVGHTVFEQDLSSVGARAYGELVREVKHERAQIG
jgi:chromosome partitioning protein